MHFLKVKKIGTNPKLLLDSRSKVLLLILCAFFNDANVIKENVFLQGRSRAQPICEEGLKQNQFVRKV